MHRVAWIASAWFAVVACTAPTLPLPPPEALTFVADDYPATSVAVSGVAAPEATVRVENERTAAIAETTADAAGVFALAIDATTGDRIRVRYTSDGETSEAASRLVPLPLLRNYGVTAVRLPVGDVRAEGNGIQGATVVCRNLDRDVPRRERVLMMPSGLFQIEILAMTGDRIACRQSLGDEPPSPVQVAIVPP